MWKLQAQKQKLLLDNARTISEQKESALTRQYQDEKQRAEQAVSQITQLQKQLENIRLDNTKLLANLENLRQKGTEQQAFLKDSQQLLKSEFSQLAGNLLDEKNRKLQEQNQLLLNPLKEQLHEFKTRVDAIHTTDTQQQASLREELRHLRELNNRITTEASNLTKALQGKGTSQKQGAWGEMILERLLEESGLTKGREYVVQKTFSNEETHKLRPDVVVHLPDNKDVVIDSKVTLNAYARYHGSESEEDKELSIKQLCQAIRSHITELSDRDYSEAVGVTSLDLVLMFIPVEGAYIMALTHDPELFEFAFSHRIALIGPSTLPGILKIIHYLWRTDQQNKNAQDIARRAASLYDKVRLVVEDVNKLDMQLQRSVTTLGEVKNRLSFGRGNLVNQVEKFRKLGVGVKRAVTDYLEEDDETIHTEALPVEGKEQEK